MTTLTFLKQAGLTLAIGLSISTAAYAQQNQVELQRPPNVIPPRELKVVGKHLQTADGKVVILQGVNIPSLEYTVEGENVLQNIAEAIDVWNATLIRLPMSQDNWFGKYPGEGAGKPAQTDDGVGYRKLIDDCVNLCSRKGAYILLDLHWNDGGDWTRLAAQRNMPDEHSLLFWQDVAKKYANNPAVFFDLYNEPHSISWDIWRNGGMVNEGGRGGGGGARRGRAGVATQPGRAGATTQPGRAGGAVAGAPATRRGAGGFAGGGFAGGGRGGISYNAIGLQTLLEAVRAAGAKNVIIAGGLDYAYDLRGIVDGYDGLPHGYALEDKDGNGIMYSTHIYPWKKNWAMNIGGALEQYCVYVGEFGSEAPGSTDQRRGDEDPYTWVPNILGFIQKNQLSWTAWSFHSRVHPYLFTDDNLYTPSPHWGAFVKAALLGAKFEMNGPPR